MKKAWKTASEVIRKYSGYLFVGAILLVMLMGLVQTVFFPDEIVALENRYANKLEPFTVAGYLDGSFQDSVDAALGDQVTLSSTFKKMFQKVSSHSVRLLSQPFLKMDYFRTRYFQLGTSTIFGGTNLVYYMYPQSRTSELDLKIEDYNKTFAAFPDTQFYMYYIEKDTDINLQTNEKAHFYEYLRDRLELSAENMGCFTIDSFEEFRSYFYETDHHWNYLGSYQGYSGVMELLGVEEELLQPVEAVHVSDAFSGSKATSYASSYSEEFVAYRFEFPEMDIQINGAAAEDYGQQEYYLSGQSESASYGTFYGGDDGEIVFSTNRPERDNILVIGESYDNAILKLIASHYNCTYSIDLRYYEAYMQEPFSLSEYLQENEIDQVLLIGNIDYYLMPEFMIGE